MKYYSTWQEALQEYIVVYGHNYRDSYSLLTDFEERLQQNRVGTYFIYIGDSHDKL